MKRRIFWLLYLLILSNAAVAQDTIYVDAGDSSGQISPYVFGSSCGDFCFPPPDMIPYAQALGLKFLKNGGDWSDERDFQPLRLDLFVALAHQIGAEPAITVRLYQSTPEAAAEVVRYANVEKGYQVRFWSIGNEPNLYAERFDVEYTTEDLNREWRAIAEAMLAVDPNIVLIGPEITQYVILSMEADHIEYLEKPQGGRPRDSKGRDWMQEFLKANGDLVDIVSIHRYPFPRGNTPATIDDLRLNTAQWDPLIANLRTVVQEATGRDLPIAVTEFNSHWNRVLGGEATPDSNYNAIWFADVLGRLIRHQVAMIVYFDLQSSDSRGGMGLLARYDVRPTYYVFMLYQKFGTELVSASSDGPDVSIYAARREDRALTLMVVNLGADEKRKTLRLDNFVPSERAEVWRFDAGHNAERIEDAELADGVEIVLPAQSITLYVLPTA